LEAGWLLLFHALILAQKRGLVKLIITQIRSARWLLAYSFLIPSRCDGRRISGYPQSPASGARLNA
jgi:hypothetical protein